MNPQKRRRTSPAMLVAALVAVLITTVWESRTREATSSAPERVEQPARVPAAVPAPTSAPAAPTTSNASADAGAHLDAVVESRDEREALERTLVLIDRGGPFPYPGKDGSTFANRERRLPKKPRGYYREFTVPTAGASDRGARRVVTGREGERWYTRDHYRTFTRVHASAPVR